MKTRIKYLDFAKAIGVFLVVLGHMPSLVPEPIRMWIFSFHMPLFFIASGYFAKMPNSINAVKKQLVRKTQKLLFGGYLTFAAVFLLFDSLIYKLSIADILDTIKSILLGSIDKVYWFFLCLFVVSVLFILITIVVKDYKKLIAIAFVFAAVSLLLKMAGINYYRIGSALYSFGFYLIGFLIKEKQIFERIKDRASVFVVCIFVSVVGSGLALGFWPKILDINNNYSHDIVINYLLAIAGSYMVFFTSFIICEKIGEMFATKLLIFIGMNSMVFFPVLDYMPGALSTVLNNSSVVIKMSSYLIGFIIASLISLVLKVIKGVVNKECLK